MNKSKFIFLSAISGNVLEYYDFTVYSVFSPIIGRVFFPGESEFVGILLSLGVFAVGFLTRPIGGIVFGYIGDRYGRRIALIISMLGMTVPTFIMGLIPSYESIGVYAPVTLIIMRLIQGLCISGEGTGAAIFILEHRQNLRPGFTAGLVHGSNIAGTLIATFIGIIIERYFSYIDFAWRFAFLLGGFMGLAGFYLRLRVAETPIFIMLEKKKKVLKAPFSNVVRTAWKSMFITICVAAIASSIMYLVKTYINVFYHNVMHYDNTLALSYLAYSSFVAMVAMPLAGGTADIIGKFRMLVLASIAILILILPTMLFMSSEKLWQQIAALTVLGTLAGTIAGTAYIFVISLFTPEQKFSGVAFSYNFGVAIFGGTSPIISRWLVEKTELFYAPAFYIMIIASIFLIIMYLMRNIVRRNLR
ncbi:MFS transporter [Rickettsia endosymbiont of Orchestes rusci]|uniref:MFS transporter n=1 Tax=Rickettsia endosymbiont of Orchestes rusci TaxID=3066250 RepID=UPI00209F834B|nr:MFS transporter [Rickettsia endosymbiont of Ceutorhynchus assimilis]